MPLSTSNDAGDNAFSWSLSRRSFLGASALLLVAGCARPGEAPEHAAFVWGEEGDGEGDFRYPRAVGVHHGRVYVLDATGRIQVFTREGVFVHGWRMPEHDRDAPAGIAFADDDRVLVPDTHYSRIVEFTTEGDIVRMWGKRGREPGQFIHPTGIVESPHHLLYISQYGGDAAGVQVYDSEHGFVRAWGRRGDAKGEFNRAMAIAMSPAHVVYVADSGNHRIQCFDVKGNVLGIIESAGSEPGQLRSPRDIALAPDGTLLVCESGNNRISRFAEDGAFLGAFGRPGAAPGQLRSPEGVAVSDTNDVFIADTGNHRIQRIPLAALNDQSGVFAGTLPPPRRGAAG